MLPLDFLVFGFCFNNPFKVNYIFITSLFPKELSEEIIKFSEGNMANAANVHQWNITKGLSAGTHEKVFLINAPAVGSFPKFYRKLCVPGCKFELGNSIFGLSVGYFNLALVKNIFIYYRLRVALSKLLKDFNQTPTTIYVYGMYHPYMKAAINVKSRFKNLRLFLIVPDLPEYMANSTGLIWKLRAILKKDLYKLIPKFDGFILLTDAMATRLNIHSKPWVRVEGMIDSEEHRSIGDSNPINSSNKKIIFYSGTLAWRYGILDLLEAFENISDSSYELWVCGAGDAEDAIKDRALVDKRIKFYGLVPREKVLQLQQLSTILVNPRSSKGKFTNFSFPSKTMEYMLSGKPVVMRKLPGVPEDYHLHLVFTEDDSVEMLKKSLIDVCEMDKVKRDAIGSSARSFVIHNKNYEVQTKKILEISL